MSASSVRRHCRLLFAVAAVLAALLPTGAHPAGASTPFGQRGLNLLFTGSSPDPSLDQLTRKAATYGTFITNLNANAVTLVFPLFTSSLHSNVVTTTPWSPSERATPSPQALAAVVRGLESTGLRVTLRPLISELRLGMQWRGLLIPSNPAAWFRSYEAALRPYLEVARTTNVNGFVVQSELSNLSSDPHWATFIAWVHDYFRGQLVWDMSVNQIMTGPPTAGIQNWYDFYPRVPSATPASSVSDLVAGWNSFAGQYTFPASSAGSVLGEVGILATDGAYAQSSLQSLPGKFDQQIQANWFTAGCQYAKDHGYRGLTFWALYFGAPVPSMTTPTPSNPGQLQPAGLAAIKSCFTSN